MVCGDWSHLFISNYLWVQTRVSLFSLEIPDQCFPLVNPHPGPFVFEIRICQDVEAFKRLICFSRSRKKTNEAPRGIKSPETDERHELHSVALEMNRRASVLFRMWPVVWPPRDQWKVQLFTTRTRTIFLKRQISGRLRRVAALFGDVFKATGSEHGNEGVKNEEEETLDGSEATVLWC